MAETEIEFKKSYDGTYETFCCDHAVGREAFGVQQRVSHLEAENAILRSENDSEKKMVDVYINLDKKISENGAKDTERWEKQLVWNTRQDARIEALEREVRQLYSMTRLYIEADRIAPAPEA